MAAMTHRIMAFKVQGRGTFPLDMLRYDQCWPAGSDDAALIEQTQQERAREVVTIKLNMATTRYRFPTKDRWSSFGWSVVAEIF